ncbi:hypothetical protein KXD93_02275 [Mucilaginibacter sp. BJC16-A38]|uniref:hypothetical protein n=1 Tax=Mucilaginibacter phenanthrenivorans TaxID=1234842 RepID=UPI002157F8E6|nr:hypothetical protein [Mucilaginibacter phenanthrenivorans]MCR8556447.1 hypothetical protein [Mucilaginibacter phenanthrenivorans]
MKTNKILFALLVILCALNFSCGNNKKPSTTSADSISNEKKADTSIVGTGQKSVKDDSLLGDPSSKGAADPNAKLPKK